MLLGIGFGLLVLNTPVAIVVCLILPTAWAILTDSIHALHTAGTWLSPSTAWGHLTSSTVTGTTWAQAATTAALWILLPFAAGSVRVLRSTIT